MAALKREGTGNDAFDQREYDELRIHYFEPVVQHNVRLPGGRVLRKQTSPPRIDQKGRGYDALRKQIAELEKKKDKIGVWHLLRQLRAWEMRPPSLGGTALTGGAAQDGVNEVIDLSVENHARAAKGPRGIVRRNPLRRDAAEVRAVFSMRTAKPQG